MSNEARSLAIIVWPERALRGPSELVRLCACVQRIARKMRSIYFEDTLMSRASPASITTRSRTINSNGLKSKTGEIWPQGGKGRNKTQQRYHAKENNSTTPM
jgi:hypothetical protein